MKKLSAILCLAFLIGACGGNHYQRLSPITGNGYSESEIAFGRYMISYHGTDIEFCKKAGLVRAAELCLAQGFLYFKISSEQAISDFNSRTSANGLADKSLRSPSASEGEAGLQRKTEGSGYNYTVEFSKTKPANAVVYNAKEVLNGNSAPGAEENIK